jgi:hypothetical protein
MSAGSVAGDASEHPPAPLNEFAATRAALTALADPHGVPQLQALLTRAEADWVQAHTALRTAANATHSLSAFHAALAHLRCVLDPIRDSLWEYEEDADALYWARATTDAAVQPVVAVLRTFRRALNDLLFALPTHPPSPTRRRRDAPTRP